MSGYAGKEKAVKDLQGNWWYQDPMTASWYIWNGQDWQWMPGAAPRIASRQSEPASKKRPPWSCLLTALIGGLIALIVVGGITLVAYKFFPVYYISPGQGDMVQIVKLGGGGLLVSLLGLYMLYAGFGNLITPGMVAEDEKSRGSKKLGCGTILNGLGQLLFGLLFLSAGLSMITVAFYQEVLPWLGL